MFPHVVFVNVHLHRKTPPLCCWPVGVPTQRRQPDVRCVSSADTLAAAATRYFSEPPGTPTHTLKAQHMHSVAEMCVCPGVCLLCDPFPSLLHKVCFYACVCV